MKEQNRLRLGRLTARYADRIEAKQTSDESSFLREFEEVRDRVLRPAMEEIATELRAAGHKPEILLDKGPETPSIELALGLHKGPGKRNVVGFCVIRWSNYPLQILAYLEVNPPKFDLERFANAAELNENHVEQMVVDAVEHIISCNAP